jgi:hypothetical protein
MTDERLRELERRWKESGSVEDEAAYLLERVRVGDLDQERLQLAAYCGHSAAAHATGVASDRAKRFVSWASALQLRFGFVWVVEGTFLALTAPLTEWEAELSDDRASRMAGAISEWLQCPCEQHGLAVGDRADQIGQTLFQEIRTHRPRLAWADLPAGAGRLGWVLRALVALAWMIRHRNGDVEDYALDVSKAIRGTGEAEFIQRANAALRASALISR